jgi:hypothetical protein
MKRMWNAARPPAKIAKIHVKLVNHGNERSYASIELISDFIGPPDFQAVPV